MSIPIDQEQDTKFQVAEYFSGKNEFWETVYKENPETDKFIHYHMRKRKEVVLKYIDEYAGNKTLRVLDVGCGTGSYLNDILDRGHEAFGIDLSLNMVKEASAKLSGFNQLSAVIYSDVERLPFPSGFFDAISCVGVLEYLTDENETLLELKRVVKPGGAIIFTLPNKYKMKNLFDPYYYLVRIWKYIFVKLGIKKKSANDLSKYSTNESFTNKRYSLTDLHKLTRISNLSIKSYSSLGFGQLTFWRKDFLPLKFSLKLNKILESRSTSFNFLNRIPNRWVINTRRTV